MEIIQKGKFLILTLATEKTACEIFKHYQYEYGVFFLDSSQAEIGQKQYSFIGIDPFYVFESNERTALENLRQKYRYFYCEHILEETPFPAGIVGFISYDYGVKKENSSVLCGDDVGRVPEVYFGFYDVVLTFDHEQQKIYITGIEESEGKNTQNKKRIVTKIRNVYERLQNQVAFMKQEIKNQACLQLTSNFTREQYCDMIRKALEYIRRGDIYQVNLSHKFTAKWGKGYPLSQRVYRILREISPSCFSAYFSGRNFQILSSSPERFLQSDGCVVRTRPMKGTRPRGQNEWEDIGLETELLASEKDQAELLMITDLMRNDIGRVCRYGSVQVKELRVLERYSTVFQTTALIEGILSDDKDVFDLLQVCLPGGSITGCPKIRAMQIIQELERTRRSIYTGSLGYVSYTGQMDFNILIRTILVLPDQIIFQVGGGIVADSDPEKEYTETLVKAEAIFQALKQAMKD